MKKSILTYSLLLCCILAWAQTPIDTVSPYSCSFEEKEDLSAWNMKYGTPTATDQWMVGSAEHSEGQRSMYISSNKKNPRYGNHPNIVVSYLRYKFPKAGSYDISFDWKCVGNSENARMYLMICPEFKLTDPDPTNPYYLDHIISSTSGTISPNVVQQACQQFGGTTNRFLCGSDQWHNTDLTTLFRVSSTTAGMPFAIVFVWVNDNTDEKVDQLSICIDNLEIVTGRIKKPTNVQVEPICEDSTMLVSWESGLEEFEVHYRKVGHGTWRRLYGIKDGDEGFKREGMQCSYILQDIAEATYDVRVRGLIYEKDAMGRITDTIYSNYAYKNLTLVYCPDNHCVNYLDLYDTTRVICTYGYHPQSSSHKDEDPYTYIGVLNDGPESARRHTIHVDPTETDSIADDELFKVPPGALASVRLGDYLDGGNAEAITYIIDVDAENQGILIVKYAVVVESSGHERYGEPFFRLEILDENGQLIEDYASCGHADYAYSDAVESGDLSNWHISKSNEKIAWKDWTTVGVNLMLYAGQTIKARFTTSDCYLTDHLGYAYFTVDCATARLETESCGNDAKIVCHAPEGFSYAWYKGDPEDPGNKPFWFDRELEADPDRQEYTCRVSFLEDPGCYFDLKTVSAPRFPVPDYWVEPIYEKCSSKLRFHNTSHVMTRYEGEESHTKEPVNDLYWHFTRLSDGDTISSYSWNPLYDCPYEGDTIIVRYTTYIGVNNACDSTRIDTIVVPNIIPETTHDYRVICAGEPVVFGKKNYMFEADTNYMGVFQNFAGCDSISWLHLKVWPRPKDSYRHDSICSDQHAMVNGIWFNQPITDTLFHFNTIHGCDSVMHYTLTINERLQAKVDTLEYLCADSLVFFITYDISEGVYDSLEIKFNTSELRDTTIYDPDVSSVAIPYPKDILPGHYMATITFHQFCCGPHIEKRAIDIRYRSSIVVQKWDDVLALLNPDNNGGFQFTEFQWYKNDQPIDGATHSYLNQKLDRNSEYYVVVTRPDGVSIATCPITPREPREQVSEFPTIVEVKKSIQMYMPYPTTIWYYTAAGQLYSTFTLPQGYTSLATPDQKGVFIIKATNSQGETQAQVMIVE